MATTRAGFGRWLAGRELSLSSFFPAGTAYYYGYPAGEDSGFLNNASPAQEELIAARAFGCAGPDVAVVGYASGCATDETRELYEALRVPQLPRDQIRLLPEHISTGLQGKARNAATVDALEQQLAPGSLVMAQPHLHATARGLYRISPDLISCLNDKSNLAELIDPELLPRRLGGFASGAQFYRRYAELAVPCVVKVAASSAGDGVYICRSSEDVAAAARALTGVEGAVFVEELLEGAKDFAVQFGVPHDTRAPIEILGVNEQLVSAAGRFAGGIIRGHEIPSELEQAVKYLRDVALPKVRALGWYGVGGMDVLADASGRTAFIDGNFRMTAMTAFHFLMRNEGLRGHMITFTGEIHGDAGKVRRILEPHVCEARVRLVNLVRHGASWRFNAALVVNSGPEAREPARTLVRDGVVSAVLSGIA